MALTGRFVPHAVSIETSGGVSDWIDGLVDMGWDNGLDVFEESASSVVDRELVAIRARASVMNFTTLDLSFFAVCGIAGIHVSPDADDAGVTAWGRYIPLGGVRDAVATTSHLKASVTNGLMVPVSIQGSHNQAARLSLALHAYLGTVTQAGATPIVFTKDQAITAGAAQLATVYVPVACKITSGTDTLFAGITDINVDMGIEVLKEGSDSEVDISHVSIIRRAPVISFTSKDLESLKDVTEDGKVCTALSVYFQQVTAAGRTAKGTGAHISVSSTKGLLVHGAASLAHNTPGTAGYTYRPAVPAAADIITVATNAVIPTT